MLGDNDKMSVIKIVKDPNSSDSRSWWHLRSNLDRQMKSDNQAGNDAVENSERGLFKTHL